MISVSNHEFVLPQKYPILARMSSIPGPVPECPKMIDQVRFPRLPVRNRRNDQSFHVTPVLDGERTVLFKRVRWKSPALSGSRFRMNTGQEFADVFLSLSTSASNSPLPKPARQKLRKNMSCVQADDMMTTPIKKLPQREPVGRASRSIRLRRSMPMTKRRQLEHPAAGVDSLSPLTQDQVVFC